jgi:hypothetical protein
MLTTTLNVLKNHTPSTLSAPPSALQTTIIEIPGPLTRRYDVVNSPLPRELFAGRKKQKSKTETACLFARIEFFHDETARRRLDT